ncbi:hypothetical protein Acsp04_34280 [Actinomadura sp. NBRC 104425]|nr:hypothetical protein Acsp04_34280 [Actinomadura sp. NBRC 104425]
MSSITQPVMREWAVEDEACAGGAASVSDAMEAAVSITAAGSVVASWFLLLDAKRGAPDGHRRREPAPRDRRPTPGDQKNPLVEASNRAVDRLGRLRPSRGRGRTANGEARPQVDTHSHRSDTFRQNRVR